MKTSAIKNKIHPKLYKILKQEFDEFRPCQAKAIDAGLLNRKNLLVCTPTASGKTLVAEIAAINAILTKLGKVVYIVPLKSLASEKYREFKAKYEPLGVKVSLSIGDLDASDPWLANSDLIIVTAEKLDSLIRHSAVWIPQVSTVIVDEVHLLNDYGRGPTLEILITLLRELLPNMQLIALSATIGNPAELGKWLNAEVVLDNWRPIKLYQGVFLHKQIDFFGDSNTTIVSGKVSDPTLCLAINTIKNEKQALIFCPTKSIAESTAFKLANLQKRKETLAKEASAVLSALSRPTRQCKKLAECIERGVAFHHAGLVRRQREIVEDCFRKSKIKVICCTPTLAMGLNLPADVAIMKSLKRYSGRMGSTWIPVLDYYQMVGRAGRPTYSNEGFAISIAASEDDKESIKNKYVFGEPEEITSKLTDESILRSSVLSLIASNFISKKGQLIEFFSKSFYGCQCGEDWSFQEKLLDILKLLELYGFIKAHNEYFIATRIGKRVSELYLDPETAFKLIKCLQQDRRVISFSFLQIISNTVEMYPLLNARNKDMDYIEEGLIEFEPYILDYIPKEWDSEYKGFINSFKTALMLQDWINEFSEEYILEKYNIRPGELRVKLLNADWLLYSCSELARLLKLKEMQSAVDKTRLRVKHGIKTELIPLIRLRGIGRYRARLLFNKGWRNLRDLRKSSLREIASVVKSTKLAKSIKEQLGQQTVESLNI